MQDETRIIQVLWFGAAYIRDFTDNKTVRQAEYLGDLSFVGWLCISDLHLSCNDLHIPSSL